MEMDLGSQKTSLTVLLWQRWSGSARTIKNVNYLLVPLYGKYGKQTGHVLAFCFTLTYLQDWAALDKLMVTSRANALQRVQKLVEMQEFLRFQAREGA